MKQVLLRYITSQLVIVTVIFFVLWILLSLLGVAYPVLLAALAGSLSVVPFFGMGAASVVASLVAVFDTGRFLPHLPPAFEGLAILILYFFINQLTDLMLTPLLVGKIVKIHPLLVFVSVLFGTVILGPVGALIATPVLLVVKTAIDEKSR